MNFGRDLTRGTCIHGFLGVNLLCTFRGDVVWIFFLPYGRSHGNKKKKIVKIKNAKFWKTTTHTQKKKWSRGIWWKGTFPPNIFGLATVNSLGRLKSLRIITTLLVGPLNIYIVPQIFAHKYGMDYHIHTYEPVKTSHSVPADRVRFSASHKSGSVPLACSPLFAFTGKMEWVYTLYRYLPCLCTR